MPKITGVILAAGKGVRMRSAYPKVVHMVSGRPMIQHVVDAVQAAGITNIYVVVGHGREYVIESLEGFEVEFVTQEQQLGTGHALKQTETSLINHADRVLVLSGDIPLIRSSTLTSLLTWHMENNAAATVLSAKVDDPTGYGRIIRNEDQSLYRIVEEKDATPEEKQVTDLLEDIKQFSKREKSKMMANSSLWLKHDYYLVIIQEGLVNSFTGPFYKIQWHRFTTNR